MTTATWTPERVEQLRTHIATGLTCSEIAAEIGVSRNAVIGKIHRLGLAPGRPTSGSGSGTRVRVRTRTPVARATFAALAATSVFATDLRRPCFARQRHQCRPDQGRRDRVRRKHPALLAARTRRVQLPLAGEQRQRRRFCFLRKQLGQRISLLRRPRADGLSHPGAARVTHDLEQPSRRLVSKGCITKIACARSCSYAANETASRRRKLNLGCICNQRACTAQPLRKVASAVRNGADRGEIVVLNPALSDIVGCCGFARFIARRRTATSGRNLPPHTGKS